ncbi:MAG: Cob(I)yrinic acid a,c-diamide adenosyltransferase [Syntrophorhabdus sp. PtaU1.Bin050]|nr:MAG: Cob(I)yrinic acid a,c-diamide adenosyltransferase [Syntrophorhabdus sp. PtaU1.Bin050]
MQKNGITIVYTGNGKGKTTAALGVALRASGHNMRTLIIQFIKEKGASGEHKACPTVLKNVDTHGLTPVALQRYERITGHSPPGSSAGSCHPRESSELLRAEGVAPTALPTEGATRAPLIEIYPFGTGFVFKEDNLRPHVEMAEQAWFFMEQTIAERKFDILILDELAVALDLGLLTIERVMHFLAGKSEDLHVIITGRNAPRELIEFADVVTEMTEIKHVYRKGVSAIKGLDY